jgi:dGTPase
MTLDWKSLLNDARRKPKGGAGPRTEFERDHDRILFSTPVRRLADKTQVFPLETHDSVRTRLTHSLEVSNLARSLGTTLAFKGGVFPSAPTPERNVPAVLGAAGLAHDLGNPPFGHQGEAAMREWFAENQEEILRKKDGLSKAMCDDFLSFDGNAQTLRLVTKLQVINDDFGLNLTYGTLAVLMKYTVPSDKVEKPHKGKVKQTGKGGKKPPPNYPGRGKPGFFQSERQIVEEVWSNTGLKVGIRHPLTYIVEAADDIAYAVIDAEDAVKKSLASFSDLIAYLRHALPTDAITKSVVDRSEEKHKEYRTQGLTHAELNDVSMQKFRVYAMEELINAVTETFLVNSTAMMEGLFEGDLVGGGKGEDFWRALKEFDRLHAYQNRSVRRIELVGNGVIKDLMTYFWRAIVDRKSETDPTSERKAPFGRYAYSLISDNYRRVFELDSSMPMRYRELRLLTDMVAGMTDSFAMSVHKELKALER